MDNQILKNENSFNVYDAENNEWVEITPEMRMEAEENQMMLNMGSFIYAHKIKEMFDKRLYLAFGCQTRLEYCSIHLPFGYRQAKKYYSIGKSFESANLLLYKGLDGDDSIKLLEKGNPGSPLNPEVLELGVKKLYEVSRLEDEELKELVKTGKVNLENGSISIEELQDMTAKDVSRQITEFKKKYTTKIAQQDEKIKLLKSEKAETQKTMNDLAAQNRDLREEEQKFGAVASKYKEKRNKLIEANKLLDDFVQTAIRSGVTYDDQEELRIDLVNLIGKVDNVHTRLMSSFSEVLIAAE